MARPKKIETRRTDNLCEVKVNIDYRNGIIKRQSFYSDISKDDARKKATALQREIDMASATGVAVGVKDVEFNYWCKNIFRALKRAKFQTQPYTVWKSAAKSIFTLILKIVA